MKVASTMFTGKQLLLMKKYIYISEIKIKKTNNRDLSALTTIIIDLHFFFFFYIFGGA